MARLKLDELQFGRTHGFQNQPFQLAQEPIHLQPHFYHESPGEIDVELDLSDN